MIFIDYKDRRPIYEQIVERFQMMIARGILEPDSQMPSVRKLATDLAINPNTIQKAYAILEQNGYIYPVKGRGNFVTGGEKLLRQKQEAFLQTFREQVKTAKELGIPLERVTDAAAEVYERQGNVQSPGGMQTNAVSQPGAWTDVQSPGDMRMDAVSQSGAWTNVQSQGGARMDVQSRADAQADVQDQPGAQREDPQGWPGAWQEGGNL